MDFLKINCTRATRTLTLTGILCTSVLLNHAPQALASTTNVAGGQAEHIPVEALRLIPLNTSFQVPWGLAVLPDNNLLVTERGGELYRLDSHGQKTLISGTPKVHTGGQGGLLDVVIHPDFENNQWVYFSYSKPLQGKSQTAIARATLEGNTLNNWQDLYVGNHPSTRGQHFGSRMVLHDGYLFFTIGDRGNRDENPQSLSRDGGKVYRLHDDGRVPEDNPFVKTDGALQAIWSYGHRNPQGLSFDNRTQTLWLHEHGPRGGDELNLIEPGNNYGWPLATFGINYAGTKITDNKVLDGTVPPAWYWTPSIAPSGLTTVSATRYPSLGDGLLAGSLKFGELHFRPHAEKNFRVIMDGLKRVRSLATSADGTVYVGITSEGVFQLK